METEYVLIPFLSSESCFWDGPRGERTDKDKGVQICISEKVRAEKAQDIINSFNKYLNALWARHFHALATPQGRASLPSPGLYSVGKLRSSEEGHDFLKLHSKRCKAVAEGRGS